MLWRAWTVEGAGVRRIGVHRIAIAAVALSSVGYSLGGLLFRHMEVATAWHVMFHRGYALATLLTVFLAFRHRDKFVVRVHSIGRAGLLGALLCGLAPPFYLLALTSATVANVLFIQAAIPFYSAVGAWLLLGERVERRTWFAMAIAFGGLALMMGNGMASGRLLGNAFAIASGVVFAGYVVALRHGREMDMLPLSALSGVVTALCGLTVLGSDFALPLHDMLLCWLWALLAGGGSIMYTWASRHLRAAEITLVMLVEYVLGPLWVWWIVAEEPAGATLAGGAVVLGAVLVWALSGRGVRMGPVG